MILKKRRSTLKRRRQAMPAFVREALEKKRLTQAYRERPPYQRNDYLGWISRGAREATRNKRLAQMLDELERGDSYMGMSWRPILRRIEKASARRPPRSPRKRLLK